MLFLFIIIGGSTYVVSFEVDRPSENALLAIVAFLVLLYTHFLTKYVKIADENLANKEVIEEFTKINEKIKNELSLVNENKLSFQTLKRESVINYYESYTQWLYYIMNSVLPQTETSTIRQKVEELMFNYNICASRLRLFDDKVEDYLSTVK